MTERQPIEKTSAETAARIFREVSIVYPASASFQGTQIAQTCSEQGLEPAVLGRSLLADDRLITELTKKANILHGANGAKFEDGSPVVITEERTRTVINETFLVVAEQMSIVSEVERRKFLAGYDEFKKMVKDLIFPIVESFYRGRVLSLFTKEVRRRST